VSESSNQSTDAARHFADAVVDAVFAAWAQDLVERVDVRPGERVLDVGCGTGAVARAAAPRAGATGKVAGIDNSAERLGVAQSLPPLAGAMIEWRLGDATALPYADGSFDVVLCQQVLHLISDRAIALAEMRRVLAPGGRLGLSVWQAMEHSPAFLPIAAAVARHLGPAEAGRFGRNFSLGDEAELRRLVEEAGFTQVQIVQETKIADLATPEDFIQYQMDVNAARWSTTPETQAAIVADVREGLQPFVEDGRLRFPRGAHVVLARRD
jgi:ubiquinone/menaquinone biosynthesis C-methylase UbiE